MRFRDFAGNETLISLLRQNGLPQASIFAGPEGVGKKSCSLALAALFNCRQPENLDSCGECPSCVKADAGNHPDIRLYEPEGPTLKIEEMRQMSREVQFRPFEGRLRYFVVDHAELLTESAANSILKTLEEPPETSKIVLVSSHPMRLLPTIVSRCQILQFAPLQRSQIESILRGRGEENAAERAWFAGGSIGQALSLDLETLIDDRDKMLDLLEGWTSGGSFERIFRACETADMRRDLKNRIRVRSFLDRLQSIIHDVYFIHVGTPERVVNRDRLDGLEELSEKVNLDWNVDLLYHVSQAQWDVDHFINPLMCFETLWLRSHRRPSHVTNRYRQV